MKVICTYSYTGLTVGKIYKTIKMDKYKYEQHYLIENDKGMLFYYSILYFNKLSEEREKKLKVLGI